MSPGSTTTIKSQSFCFHFNVVCPAVRLYYLIVHFFTCIEFQEYCGWDMIYVILLLLQFNWFLYWMFERKCCNYSNFSATFISGYLVIIYILFFNRSVWFGLINIKNCHEYFNTPQGKSIENSTRIRKPKYIHVTHFFHIQ